MNYAIRDFLINLANIFLGIVTFFLGLRIIFLFFSANAAAPIVSWIYTVSNFFMVPFRGIFPQTAIRPGSIVDLSAIIALIIYALLVYLFIALIRTIISPTHSPEHDYHA